ncbi:MAG: hypothetical protein NVSMB12_19430 [Acidimicrobiales bacterium]
MADEWVLIIDGGEPHDRRPVLAFGPFGSAAAAEAWRRANRKRWASVSGWRTRIGRRGDEGDLELEAP